MTTLARWQQDFLERVLDPHPRTRSHALYQANILENYHASLAATYPVVRRLVGDAFFREAAREYALRHRSTSGDLHGYGEAFADFLARYGPASALAYLADVACLEWACAEAYDAADGARFDFAALVEVPPERRGRIVFFLQPAARLLRSSFPVASIHEANQADRDGSFSDEWKGEHVLVHREGLEVRVRTVDADVWRFLAAIDSGRSLGEMAEDPVLAPVLEPQLLRWTALEVVSGFRSP
jgi:hypothetical protein